MATNNRFAITDASWSVTGENDEGITNTVSYTPPIPKESFTQLQTDINAAVGGTLDLTGRAFAPTLAEVQSAGSDTGLSVRNGTGAPLTVTGGAIYGGLTLNFSGAGAVRNASLSSLAAVSWINPSGSSKIHDAEANEQPFMAVWPQAPEGMKYTPQTSNDNWIKVVVYNPPAEGYTEGTVYVDGDNKITGFQIANVADWQAFEAVLSTVEDADSMTMLYLAANNIVAEATFTYDNATKTVTFTSGPGLNYTGYLTFAVTGDRGLIVEDGQYVIETSAETVYYRPAPESTLRDVTFPVPFTAWADNFNPSSSFDGTSFYAGGGEYQLRAEGISGTVTLTNCTFQSANSAHVGIIENPVTIVGCTFDNSTGRGVSAAEGTTIQKSRFTGTAKSSGVLIQGRTEQTNPGGTPVAFTLIEDNFFSIPAANHGQGCSLYQGAWMNATVRHNIFMNCQRAFSHQGFGPDGGSIRASGGTFKFENNLVIHDYAPDAIPGGQATVSFNTSSYPPGVIYEQDIFIRNNTVLHDTDDPDLEVQTNSYTLEYFYNRYADNLQITNNFVGKWTSTKETVDGLTGPLAAAHTWRNIATRGGWNQTNNGSSGSGDVLLGSTAGWTANQSDYFDMTNLTAIGAAATYASDGGSIGHRWANSIGLSTATNPPVDWYDTYTAEAIPEDAGVANWGMN